MALTTAQAFTQFLSDITATEYQKTSIINSRKSGVDRDLGDAFPSTSDMPFWGGTLMGSASKNTIIRPLDDVDVLAVFSNGKQAWNKYRSDSYSFIYRVRDAYNGYHVQQVGTRGQAVRVFYDGGGHVDVAPVFSQGDGVYHLPNGSGGWLLTAPTVANDWFAEQNRILSHQLAPLVRLLKAWNRAHSNRMQSFHLETVAASIFSSLGNNHRDAMQKFFQWAPNQLYVNDPGGHSGDLGSYLTWHARQELLIALSSAAERARIANAAETLGHHEEAKRLWKIILGSSFPS